MINKVIVFLLTVVFFVISSTNMMGQQLPLLHQNFEQVNPSFLAGSVTKFDYSTKAVVSYRMQWLGVQGSPETLTGNFSHWNDDLNLLIGGELINDETGPTQFTGVYGNLAYGIQFDDNWLLNIGIKGGLVQYRIKGEELNFLELGDFTKNNVQKIFPDFALGATLYFDEKYYLGFSIPQAFGLELTFKEALGDYNIKRVQHYYGLVGARFDVESNTWLDLSSEVRYLNNVPLYVSGNINFEFREIFWATSGISNAKELRFGVGGFKEIGDKRLKIGYNLSQFFQSYGAQFGTTHEFQVSMYWN